MSDFVLDASVTLAWCFEDEATPVSHLALERLAAESASVPSIWHVEVANVLALAERRRRITLAESAEFIARLENLLSRSTKRLGHAHLRGFSNLHASKG